MEIVIVVIFVFGVLTMLAAIPIAFLAIGNRDRRSASFHRIATRLNLQFQSQGAHGYADKCSGFNLMSNSHGTYHNSIFGKYDDVDVAVFDYNIYDPASDSSSTVQTVFMVHSDKIDLPGFRICPNGLFEYVASALGYKNVKLKNAPKFSRAFYLKAANEADVIELFDDEQLREWFRTSGHITCEANGKTFIWYRNAKTIRPQRFDQFWEEGFETYRQFVEPNVALSHGASDSRLVHI